MKRPGAEAAPADESLGRLRAELSRLARAASLETAARQPSEVESYASLVAPGTRVFLAWIPGSSPERAVAVSSRLRELGLIPVPHIAARELPGHGDAADLLARLHGEAGVTEALLIAGDAPAPRGPFQDSLSLLQTGLFERNGITRLGIAGYPEGHARVPTAGLAAALDAKREYAATHGMDLYLVTQFGFDGGPILDWLRGLRERGITLPVRVGLAGPAKLGTLIRYGLRCGIGNSLRALSASGRQAAQLLAAHGPEAVLAALARGGAGLGIEGVHLFTFGGFARSAGWLRNVAEGRFELTAEGGFRVMEP
jgi:methylenetetrahydrofolate reductase (NADPH)